MKRSPCVVILALTLGLPGCSDSSRTSSPAAPSPAPTPNPGPTPLPAGYTLSGLVFLATPTGRVPLDGVRVDEGNSQANSRTGKDGLYYISGLTGDVSVAATRWDVVTYATTITMKGDTRFDIELPVHTLSGVVFERTGAGTVPIEGVNVYCDGCGSPYGHTFESTDANGFYSFAYTFSGTNPLQIWKSGYVDAARRPMVDGDTRFDVELVRR